MPAKVTADMMRRALYRHFSDRWAVLFEVEARADPVDPDVYERYLRREITWLEMRATQRQARRIDALLVRRSGTLNGRHVRPLPARVAQLVPAPPADRPVPDGLFDLPAPTPATPAGPVDPGDDGGIDRFAVEIKVTRADFLHDVANPDKQAPWRDLAHRHAYAVPAGLVNPREVPAGSGLIAVTFRDGESHCKFARNAPRAHTASPLPLTNVLDLAWRLSRAEALTRGVVNPVYDVAGDDVEAMRARLRDLEHKLGLATNEAERQRGRADRWRKRYGACVSPPCSVCAKPLRPTRADRSKWDRRYAEWDHLTEEDHVLCLAVRTARTMEAECAAGRTFDGYMVPTPEPAEPET